jgi:hypothetical protein
MFRVKEQAKPEDGGSMFLSNNGELKTVLHSAKSHKIVLFIVSKARTSNSSIITSKLPGKVQM